MWCGMVWCCDVVWCGVVVCGVVWCGVVWCGVSSTHVELLYCTAGVLVRLREARVYSGAAGCRGGPRGGPQYDQGMQLQSLSHASSTSNENLKEKAPGMLFLVVTINHFRKYLYAGLRVVGPATANQCGWKLCLCCCCCKLLRSVLVHRTWPC